VDAVFLYGKDVAFGAAIKRTPVTPTTYEAHGELLHKWGHQMYVVSFKRCTNQLLRLHDTAIIAF